MSDQPKRTFVHVIHPRYCKGCNICVSFCPKHVLVLKANVVYPASSDLCIGCRMCEYRCPDFAIEVREESVEPEGGPGEGEFDVPIPSEANDE